MIVSANSFPPPPRKIRARFTKDRGCWAFVVLSVGLAIRELSFGNYPDASIAGLGAIILSLFLAAINYGYLWQKYVLRYGGVTEATVQKVTKGINAWIYLTYEHNGLKQLEFPLVESASFRNLKPGDKTVFFINPSNPEENVIYNDARYLVEGSG